MNAEEKMQAWAREQLGVGPDVEVTIDDGADVSGPYGCDTCGPEYDVTGYYLTLTAFDLAQGYCYHRAEFTSLGDAIRELLAWEPEATE